MQKRSLELGWLPIHARILAPILIGTGLVFSPALSCGFIGLDDPYYLLDNPGVACPLTFESLAHLWSSTTLELWHPLTTLSLHLAYQAFGLNAVGYHVINLAFHLGNVALVYVLWVLLCRSQVRAAAASILFAIHPLRVESVVWVSEIKDVASIFFGLACMIAYVLYVRSRSRALLWLSALLICVSLLYKPMLVMMPATLLLLDFWPLRRFANSPWTRLVGEKWLHFLSVAVMFGVTVISHRLAARQMGDPQFPLWLRLQNMPIAIVRYVAKSIWPGSMTVHYPMPPSWPLWQVVAAATIILFISAWAWLVRRSLPMALTGWFWFLAALLPVLGIVQVSSYSLADRYTYFAGIGLTALLLYAIPAGWFTRRAFQIASTILLTSIVIAYSVQTRRQIGYWADSKTLYLHGVEAFPEDPNAKAMLAGVYLDENRPDLAEPLLREALRIDPTDIRARFRLASLYMVRRQFTLARDEAKFVTEHAPDDPTAWDLLARIDLQLGEFPEQIAALRQGAHLQPKLASWPLRLGIAYAMAGDDAQARTQFQYALELSPVDLAEAHWNLGLIDSRHAKPKEAIAELETACRLEPDSPIYREDLGVELVSSSRWAAGLSHLDFVLERDPRNFRAMLYSGVALGHLGNVESGAKRIRLAVELDPSSALAHDELAKILAWTGHVPEALEQFRAADKLDPGNRARLQAIHKLQEPKG